jgi:hypothetical protein
MPYNDLQNVTKDDLVQDDTFLEDASSFLYNRTGKFLTEPEEIYDAYARHMRFHNTNEITVARDLMYAQEASDEDKQVFSRLLTSFDKLDPDVSNEWDEILADYGMSLATAPSTWLSAITAGTGKVAAMTGQQAAKLGVRQVLNSAKRGAVAESIIGAGQETGRQATRVETGAQEEIRGEEILTAGAIGGAFGGAGGAIAGGIAVRNTNKALALQAKAEAATAARVQQAAKVADETLATKNETASAIKERLKALDPEMTAEGRAIKEEKFTPLEMTMVSLDNNVKKAVIAAASDLIDKSDLVDADGNAIRITEALVKKFRSGSITADVIDEVREKYNLTSEQFGLIFGADLSDYGRGLNLASQLKKSVNKREALEKLVDNVQEIANAKTSKGKQLGGVTDSQLETVHELHKAMGLLSDEATGFIKGFERLRRGILTTQPQTTIRNVVGGGFRVLLDAPEYVMEEMTKKIYNGLAGRKVYETSPIATIIRNSASIMKYMSPVSVAGGSPQVAEIIAQMYARNNPDSAQRLFNMFIEGADASYNSKTFNAMSQIGAGLNFMNRYSDDVFKKAIFAGQLDRLVMTRYNKSLTEMVGEGKFQDIDEDFFKQAGEKAFELLYQKVPKGEGIASTLARGYLKADKRAISGIALGALIPFPRFVINQIEFMYDHAPILGLMSSKSTPEKMAKQMSGLGMITAAYMFRAEQGENTEWYIGKKEDGTTVDLRPFLGPLNLHMYVADLFYKHWDSTKTDVQNTAILYDKTNMKTVSEIAFGSAFRVGTGAYLINSAVPEFAEAFKSVDGDEKESGIKFQRAWGRLLGDYAATFTYALPIAVARDIYRLSDEEARIIPETNGNVSIMDIIKLRATRTLPGEWREKAIERLGGLEQEPIETVRYEITTNEPTRTMDPVGTALTGLATQRKPNMLEEELTRLGISAYDLYKPVPLGPADVLIRKHLSGNGDIPSLYNYLKPVLVDPAYKRRSKEERQHLLQSYGRAYVSDVRNQIYDVLIEKAQANEIDFTTAQILNFQLESVDKTTRKAAVKIFERDYGKFDNRNEKQIEKVIDISRVIEKDFIYDEDEKLKFAQGGLVTRKYAEGGFVSDDPMMPRDVDDQMSELDMAMAKVPASLRGYVGWKSDLAEVEKEFQSGERNVAEYILGTGYYGVAKPIEDLVSEFIPDVIEEGVSEGIASFMEFTGVDKALEKLSPRTRRNLNEMMGMSGFATPARTLTRQTNPTINKARAGRDLSSADVIIPNYYSNKLDKQVQFPGAQVTKKFLGEDKAIKHNQIAGAAQWGTKAGLRVIANMFNPSARALYKEYGISSVFNKNYNLVQKELKKLEELRSSKASKEDIGKQEMILQSILEVTQAEMIQTSHIRRQANAQATVEDVPMKFALAAADPNVPEVYFRPAQIGDDWYEKTAAQAPTAGRQISKEDADFVQEHIERVWKKDGGYDRNRVEVIAKVPASKFTGAHMESIKTSKQLNIIENAFRPEKGRGFIEFRPGKDGKLIKTYNVDKLKESIIKVNEEAPKNKKVKIEKTDDSGVWVSFSHAGRGKVEGGINVLVRVDVNGNIDGYVSDLHDFLDGVPIVGDLLNNALPTQILAVTAPMQTNVYSISTLRSARDKNKKLKAVYGENVVGRFEDFPEPPEAASKTATLERITEAAKIKPSALGVAKEVLPVAGNVTFAANVLADNEEEDTRKRGGLMSRK